MKKQILILMFLVSAVFAGMNLYAQPTQVEAPYLDNAPLSCPVPTPLTCAAAAGALNPSPGVTYTYEINASSSSSILWFVTTDVDVITSGTITSSREAIGGTYVLNAGTSTIGGNATYNNAGNNGDILEVQWNYFDPTTTVLLVAYAIDAAGCTDNVEVYKIEPVFNFILDIASLEDNGTVHTTDNAEECVSPVVSASYNGTNLIMDYGENYIYYIVSAANWVNSWEPTFVAPTSAGGSTVGSVEWAYADEANDPATVWNAAGTPVLASHYGGATTIGADGECIVLRVNIDHNANELTVAENYIVGVNGVMYDAGSGGYSNQDLRDVDEGTSACDNTVTDEATYTITPRPLITPVDPSPFVPKL